MRVRWKPYPSANIDGQPIIMPGGIDEDHSVLLKIINMPKKKPLSYAAAQTIYWEALGQSILDEKDYLPLGHIQSIQWISDQGYHIVLTGDEYEILDEERLYEKNQF